jgi:hypothetical protein
MTTSKLPPANCETHKTGGRILQTVTAFLGFLSRKKKPELAQTYPAIQQSECTIAPSPWMVTWQHPSGEIQTSEILLSGYWSLAQITAHSRDALRAQHIIENVKILRISHDVDMTPASRETFTSVLTKYQRQVRFESECG